MLPPLIASVAVTPRVCSGMCSSGAGWGRGRAGRVSGSTLREMSPEGKVGVPERSRCKGLGGGRNGGELEGWL